MIRFLPDTWREILLRPLAMAAPDAGVYIEIAAPDLRYVFAILLTAALLVAWALHRWRPSSAARPAWILTAAVATAWIPWLATTANGRYFIPVLLATGPLCVALANQLPGTRGFRLIAALGMLCLQGFAVQQNSPLQAWGLAQWKQAPYFEVDWPPDMRNEPASYVTLSSISYSLLAPQLPEASRWMHLSSTPGVTSNTAEARRAQNFLINSRQITLLAPVIPEYAKSDGSPIEEAQKVFDQQLAGHRLSLARPNACRHVWSKGIATMARRHGDLTGDPSIRKYGFWACHLQYKPKTAEGKPTPQTPARYEAVFRAIENLCPRFFAPGQTGAQTVPDGELRTYSGSEMKLYVLTNGDVYYKYYRALNPVHIGSQAEILAGKVKNPCENIQGRSGLPWEREI